MQHNLPFKPGNLYSHFRPECDIPGRLANGEDAAEPAARAKEKGGLTVATKKKLRVYSQLTSLTESVPLTGLLSQVSPVRVASVSPHWNPVSFVQK